LYIHKEDDNNNDISSFMETVHSVTSVIKGFARISKKFDTNSFLLFQIDDISNNGGDDNYWTLTVPATQAESHDSPFTANDDIIISFTTYGNKGQKGAQGFTGYTGFEGLQVTQDSKDLQVTQDSKDSQVIQDSKDLQVTQDSKDSKDIQVTQDFRDLLVTQDFRDFREYNQLPIHIQ
jgi:hypothetical protein